MCHSYNCCGELDLDGAAAREGGDADRAAGVAAGRPARDVEEHGTGPVDDRRLLVEAGGGRDEAGHRDESLDPVEVTEFGGEYRQRVEGADARGFAPLVDGDGVTEYADTGELTGDPRQLTRRP